MNKEKLAEANRLNKLIEENEQALNCFEYDKNYWTEGVNEPDMVSTEPRLIIEHLDLEDFECRTQTPIPMVLSDFLIDMIKAAIKENQAKLKAEFEAL